MTNMQLFWTIFQVMTTLSYSIPNVIALSIKVWLPQFTSYKRKPLTKLVDTASKFETLQCVCQASFQLASFSDHSGSSFPPCIQWSGCVHLVSYWVRRFNLLSTPTIHVWLQTEANHYSTSWTKCCSGYYITGFPYGWPGVCMSWLTEERCACCKHWLVFIDRLINILSYLVYNKIQISCWCVLCYSLSRCGQRTTCQWERCVLGHFRLLYSALEAIISTDSLWRQLLVSPPLSDTIVTLAVDKAHCLFKW